MGRATAILALSLFGAACSTDAERVCERELELRDRDGVRTPDHAAAQRLCVENHRKKAESLSEEAFDALVECSLDADSFDQMRACRRAARPGR